MEGSQAQNGLYVPAFSVWEVAQKESSGKLIVTAGLDGLMHRTFTQEKLQLLELTSDVLILANGLPGEFHGDPADRIIVAAAIDGNYTLFTHDSSILKYGKQAM